MHIIGRLDLDSKRIGAFMVLPKRKNGRAMKALPTGKVPPVGKNRVRELARLHLSEETGGLFIYSPRAPTVEGRP